MTITRLPSGRYRLQIRRKNLGVDEVHDTAKQARAADRDYRARGKVVSLRALRLSRAWERYRSSLAFKQKKATTQRSEETHIKAALRRFADWSVDAITPEEVEALILAELDQKKAADTIRNEIAALSSVLRFCVDRHIIARNACVGVPRPGIERKVRRMAPGDEGALIQLLNHPKLRYRSVARLCLLVRETGARPGEWVATRWNDLDLGAQKVTFPNTKYKGMPRTVPLTTAAVGLLSAQLEDITLRHFETFAHSEYIFPTVGQDGEPTPLRYSGAVRDAKAQNLLPSHFRAHSGRHEYISKLVEDSDLDDSRIMSLVGHHHPSSMQIYAHARNVRYRGQLEALEPKRREERARSFSQAAGLPTEIVDIYLQGRRNLELKDGLTDAGDELLFNADAISELERIRDKMGTSETERLQTLMKIRETAVKVLVANARKNTKRPSDDGETKTNPKVPKKT
jgi:integrase